MTSPSQAANDSSKAPEGPTTTYHWVTHGIPELLVSDNGKELVARHIRELALRLSMSLQFAPVRTPWYKGGAERTFGTFNTRLLHRIEGTTLGRPLSHLGYQAVRHAKATEAELKAVIEQYIVTVHNAERRKGKGRSANELFLQGIQRHPARMPASHADLSALFARTERRAIGQSGIQYLHLNYQCRELADLFHTVSAGTRLTISVDTADLRSIQVVHPLTGEYIKAPCVRDLGTNRYSLSKHLAVLGIMKEEGLNPQADRDLELAKLKVTRMIASISNKATKAEVRKAAAAIRQMEGLGNQTAGIEDEALGSPQVGTLQTKVISSTKDVEDLLSMGFSKPL